MASAKEVREKQIRAQWRALAAAKDPTKAFAAHFAPLATHEESQDLLVQIAARVKGFTLAKEDADHRLDTRVNPSGADVLIVDFHKAPKCDKKTTWMCAMPSTAKLAWLPPSHARALSVHNGIAHRFGLYSRLQPIHLCRLTPHDRAMVVPSDDDDESWHNVWENRAPVVEHRSDGYYYHRRIQGPEGGPALACLGHDADGLAKPYRKDLTAGDHFVAMTAFEIVFNADHKAGARVAWFPS